MKLLSMQFSPVSCYVFPLTPQYVPQHPIPEHPQQLLMYIYHGFKSKPTTNKFTTN